jgi:Ribbon-helix-helix protein, copG family
MVRTQIQLTEEQAKGLKRLAAAKKVSMAELIRQGVDAILRSDTGLDVDERRRRAIATVGRFRSGRRDISGKHDKYLAEGMCR